MNLNSWTLVGGRLIPHQRPFERFDCEVFQGAK